VRWRRHLAIGFGTPLVILLLVLAGLFLARRAVVRGLVEYVAGKLNARGGLRLEVGGVSGDPLAGLAFSDVRLSDPSAGAGAAPFFEADSVLIAYAMGDLFGERRVRSVRVVRPRIALDAIPRTRGGASGPERIALAALPTAGIDTLLVVDGEARGGRVPRITGLALDAEVRSEGGRARAAVRHARATLSDATPVVIEGEVSVTSDSVSVSGAIVRFGSSRARLEGALLLRRPPEADLVVTLDSLRIADLAPLIPSLPREGSASGRLGLRGRLDEFRVEGDLAARFGPHALDADVVRVTVRPKEVIVDSLSGRIGGAAVTGSWRLPIGGGASHGGRLRFRGVDLRAFAPPESKVPATDLSGVVSWNGSGRAPGALNGDVSLALGPGRVGDVPFDGFTAEGRVANGVLRARRVMASFLGGRVAGSGDVAFSGDLDLEATAEFEDLSRVARALRVAGARGRGEFEGRIVREGGRLLIDGTLIGETWEVSGLRLNQVDATGRLESHDGVLTIVAGGAVGGIEGYGKSLGGVRAAIRYEGGHLFLEELAGRIAGVDFEARGEWMREGEIDRFLITSLAVVHDGNRSEYPGAIEVRKEGSVFTLLPTAFPLRGGHVTASGEYDITGPLGVELRWDGIDLSSIRLPSPLTPDLLDRTKGALSISGTRQRPEVRLSLSGVSGAPDSVHFAACDLDVSFAPGGPMSAALRLADAAGRERLSIEGTLVDSLPAALPKITGGIRAALVEIARPDLVVRADSLPIEWVRGLSPALADFGGPLTAMWRFTGPIENLGASGPFAVSPLLYRGRVVAPIAGEARLGGGRIDLDVGFSPAWGASRVRADLPARLDATVPSFTFQGDAPFTLDARIEKGELGVFPLLIKEARDARGDFSLALTGTGTLAAPTLQGRLAIANGTVIVRDLVELYEDVTGELLIENSLFTMPSLTARVGEKGRVEASGTFRLIHGKADDLDFALRLRDFDVASIPECGATINADVAVKTTPTEGGWRCPHITGAIDIVGAVVEQSFRAKSVKPPTPTIFLPSVRPDWTGEITVRAPNDVWIANLDMEIELRGDGDLTLFRSTRGLGLVGRLEVVSGIYRLYYSWIANELRVEEGSIVWVDATDAQRFRISATASTEVDGERIELSVDGAPDSLNISATSESEYSQSEILRLLAIRDKPGESTTATPEILGSWVTTFSGLLTRELTRGFRGFGEVDIINVEGRPQIRVRRQLVRGVGVTYEQGIEEILGSDQTPATESERLYVPDRQVKLEYRMTRAFYLEALTGALRDGSRVYDLDLKWRLSY